MSYRANDLTSKLSPPEPPEVARLGAWGLIQNQLSNERPLLLVRSHTAFAAKAVMSVVLHKDVRHWDVRFFTQEELRGLPRAYVSALVLMGQLEQIPVNSTRSVPCLTSLGK